MFLINKTWSKWKLTVVNNLINSFSNTELSSGFIFGSFLFSSVIDNAIDGVQEGVVYSGVEFLVGLVGFRELISWVLNFIRIYWWIGAYLKHVRLVKVDGREGSHTWGHFHAYSGESG